MSLDLLEDRLKQYSIRSKQEEINSLKEIYQEIALSGLARSDFFKIAAFQGGTCLRILHKLRRFSEDLDFILMNPPYNFRWSPFLKSIELEFSSFGLELEVKERSASEGALKKAFLKDDSFGRIIELRHPILPSDRQKIQIKLEIDTNPPDGSGFTTHFLEYPYPFSITAQDLPSLFASKCHALLCRPYVKGRDWFDFLWYIAKKVPINFHHLQKALEQSGPYATQSIQKSREWAIQELQRKIQSIDWTQARIDVENFLSIEERKQVAAWNQSLFIHMTSKLDFV